MHGCCSGPVETPGHSCTQLPGRLAHSGPLQGVSEPSQGCRPSPHSCSWPQNERQEECSLPFSTNGVFGSSLGFRSNAGPSGSCPDFQPQYMFGPLQARPSCLREHLSQALRPHGRSLPCAAPGVAPHEAVPLVDETFRGPLHRTCHSPCKGVAHLLSHPFNMAGPPFSPEWGRNGRDSPSPNGHDGCIPDIPDSVRSLDRRVPLLAHKLPGAKSRLPGTDSLSPLTQGVSCDCQDRQHGGSVPHKSPRGLTVAHPKQACTLSPPLGSGQVPLLESGSRPGSLEPRSRLSVETEAQVGGVDVEPLNGGPDLGFVRQSRSGPLCIAGVVPMPTLVLPELPGTSGHRCVRSPLTGHEAVRISARQADSGGSVQGEGEWCPSPTRSPVLAVPDVVLGAGSSSVSAPLGDSDQAGPALSASGQELAPSTRDLETVGVAHPGPQGLISGLPAEVQETIASARAPSTRKLYSSKWKVFESWCLAHAVDPVSCSIGPVLEFLQEKHCHCRSEKAG